MGHITDIAEDPADGTVCLVGFQMPVIPSESQIQNEGILSQRPFYQARFAVIPADGSDRSRRCPPVMNRPRTTWRCPCR